MKILLLGEKAELLAPFLKGRNHAISYSINKISLEEVSGNDFIISFGYKHIITEDIIQKFKRSIINLHISYLPYNRGADPNIWSFLENTKKGVSIHLVEKGLDKGAILLQKEVQMHASDTLLSSYNRLIEAIIALFKENCNDILNLKIDPFYPKEEGSYHAISDRVRYESLLTDGYNTKISDLVNNFNLIMGGGK